MRYYLILTKYLFSLRTTLLAFSITQLFIITYVIYYVVEVYILMKEYFINY